MKQKWTKIFLYFFPSSLKCVRTEVQKYFRSFFGTNKNFKKSFWNNWPLVKIQYHYFIFSYSFLAGVARKKAVAIEMRHRQIPLFVTGKSNFRLFSVPSYYFYDLVVHTIDFRVHIVVLKRATINLCCAAYPFRATTQCKNLPQHGSSCQNWPKIDPRLSTDI